MVCVCINSCYLHADREMCVCLDTPLGVSVHPVEAHKCLCVCLSRYGYRNLCISMQYFIFLWVYFPYRAALSAMESWCARKALGDA